MRRKAQLASGIIAIAILISLTSVVPLPWKGKKFLQWCFELAGKNIDHRPRLSAWGAVALASGIGIAIGSSCFLFATQTGLTKNPFFYLITTTVLALCLDLIRSWAWFWTKPRLTERLSDGGYEAIKDQAWWIASKLNQNDYRRMVNFDFDWFNAYRRCAAITIACSAIAVAMSQATPPDDTSSQWILSLPNWTQMGPEWLMPTVAGGLVMTILTLSQETTIHAVVRGRHLYQQPPDPQLAALRSITKSKKQRGTRQRQR